MLEIPPLRRAGLLRLALMATGVLSGLAAIVIVSLSGDFELADLLGLFVGWSFIASGIAAWVRRPENDTGIVMVAVGTVWFVSALLKNWHASIPLTAGVWLGDIWLLPLCFLLAGFPAMRFETLDRVALAALALVMVPLELAWLMCLNFDSFASADAPANALLVWDSPDAAAAIDSVQRVIGIAALLALAVLLVRRRRRASAPLKRVLTPVLAGAAALAMFSLVYILDKSMPIPTRCSR